MKKNSIFKNRNFVFIIIGQFISIFGNSILRFALPLYVLDVTGSTVYFGSLLAISTIPIIVFSPLGGILADRVDKKKLMVWLDFFTSIIIVFSCGLLYKYGRINIIGGFLIILSIIQAFYQPSVQSSIPIVLSVKDLEKGNGIVSIISSLSNLLGPILGGVLYRPLGIWKLLVISALCFLLSAVMEGQITIGSSSVKSCKSIKDTIVVDFKESWNFITKDKAIILIAVCVVSLINLLLTSMILVGLPSMLLVKLEVGSNMYGFAQGAMAFGMIFGGLLVSLNCFGLKKLNMYIALTLSSSLLIPIGGVFMIGVSVFFKFVTIVTCCFLMMTIITIFSISTMTIIQKVTPKEILGKVISVILVITQSTLPLGQVLYGFLFEYFIFDISGVIFFTAGASIFVSLSSKNVFSNIMKLEHY